MYIDRATVLSRICSKSNKDLLARDRFVHGLPTYFKSVVLNNQSKKWEKAVQSTLMAEGVAETLGKRGKEKSKKEANKGMEPRRSMIRMMGRASNRKAEELALIAGAWTIFFPTVL